MTFSALDSGLVGPLFRTDAMAAVFADQTRLAKMLAVEAALARAEASVGLAPEALAAAIEAIDPVSLDIDAIGRATVLSAVPTIPFVKAVQARLPRELERAFHKGATTQDILDTALALQVRDALALVAADVAAVMDGLAILARTHRDAPCVGRTYGQHGAPITFGFKVAVWLAGIAEVAALHPAGLPLSLAGPVGTLAGLRADGPAVVDAMAANLGLEPPPIAWHARRARVAALGCWLAQLLGALGKMATDIASMTSTEVGEVAEPFVPGRGGSSAMPHKRNPVSCTVILSAATAAPGLASTLLAAMPAAHERPAGLWHAEWHALPSLFGLVSGALREAVGLAQGLEVDPARMRANLDLTRGLLFADAAAARLGATMGREAAHHLVEVAAGKVRAGDGTLSEVLAREAPDVNVSAAFDLAPAVAAAGLWVDRVLAGRG